MGGVSKGISNIGNSASSIAKGKANFRDWLNVTPVGAAGQVITGAAGINANKVFSGGALSGGSNPGAAQNANNGSPVFAGATFDPAADQAAIDQMGAYNFAENQSLQDKNYASYNVDQSLLNNQGQNAYNQDQNFMTQDTAARAAARDQLSGLLTQQAANSFKQTLPGTAEDYNAGGLLNSTGYQQEVARQQGQLSAGIANQMAQVGLQDVNRNSDLGRSALTNLQGYQGQGVQANLAAQQYQRSASAQNLAGLQSMQQQGLQRNMSIADYMNQANTASALGAKTAPNLTPTKAGQTSGILGGVGSGAAAGGAIGGPYGAAIGGAGGGLMSLMASQNGGRGK